MHVSRTAAGLLVVDLEFFVPVPAGNEVLVLELKNPEADFDHLSVARCAVDRMARMVYADHIYWGVFNASPRAVHPADDATLAAPWRTRQAVQGVSLGGVLSRRDSQGHGVTRLYLRPPEAEAGYRG